jgi:hypothetical protein
MLLALGRTGKAAQADGDEQQGKCAEPAVREQNRPDRAPHTEAGHRKHRNLFSTTFHKGVDSNQSNAVVQFVYATAVLMVAITITS